MTKKPSFDYERAASLLPEGSAFGVRTDTGKVLRRPAKNYPNGAPVDRHGGINHINLPNSPFFICLPPGKRFTIEQREAAAEEGFEEVRQGEMAFNAATAAAPQPAAKKEPDAKPE